MHFVDETDNAEEVAALTGAPVADVRVALATLGDVDTAIAFLRAPAVVAFLPRTADPEPKPAPPSVALPPRTADLREVASRAFLSVWT